MTSSSDAILDDILRRGPVAFSQLVEQLDRMTASERAIGELFSAVDCLLRCFYGSDTSRAWTHQLYTPTPVQCRMAHSGHQDYLADREDFSATASGEETPDDGFSGDVGVPACHTSTTRMRRRRLVRGVGVNSVGDADEKNKSSHICHARDECVDISLSYRDTDTGKQVSRYIAMLKI